MQAEVRRQTERWNTGLLRQFFNIAFDITETVGVDERIAVKSHSFRVPIAFAKHVSRNRIFGDPVRVTLAGPDTVYLRRRIQQPRGGFTESKRKKEGRQ